VQSAPITGHRDRRRSPRWRGGRSGGALGSWLGGSFFEATGGYGAAFATASMILFVACVVSLTIDERPRQVPTLAPVAGGR
jgi:hypothetical protein